MSQSLPANPVRRLVIQEQDRAALYGRDYEPGVDELRAILRKALPKPAARVRCALQAGCTPEYLEAVLDGQEDPDGGILDVLGLEWVPGRGVYADPLDDAEARALQQARWAEEIRSKRAGPLQPCPRIERHSGPPIGDIFAIGAGAPGPKPRK